jgi:phosphoribosylaminoimidazolecarboxamide formyltransferase/IMP cyclohydrolase
MRQQLAIKAFAATQHYDAMIHAYFMGKQLGSSSSPGDYPQQLVLRLKKQVVLRYGENPHQQACAYRLAQQPPSPILSARQHQGKPLSYNNILDAETAWNCVNEFTAPTCVIVKHANPCGVASAEDIANAYKYAYQADPLSAFGGIVALNEPCTQAVAAALINIFTEVVLAPAYTASALTTLAVKPNVRVLEIPSLPRTAWEMVFINGGVLLQDKDRQTIQRDALQIPTRVQPTPADVDTMLFAWLVLKHIKSNAILIAKNNMTVGMGAGQVSRIDAVRLALCKADKNSVNAVLASDAFFPFRDSIDCLTQTGIRAIVQPGGSIRDKEVIAACDEHGIAMALTGTRCFRH